MNELITKMSKTSKVISVLFKIVEVASYVGIGMTALSAVFLAVLGKTSVASTLGKITLHAGITGLGIEDFSTGMVVFIYIAIFVYLALFALLGHLVSRMFKTISKERTPFRKEFVKELRIVAATFFIISLFPEFSNGDMGIELTGVGILGTLLIWCMSYIMHYGCVLQQESDETL